MKELISIKTMSSLEIAKETDKRHDNVLAAIRNMEPAWEKINGLKFQLVEYADVKGEKRPMYQLTKPDGSILTTTTKVTGKGQIYFVNKFLKVVA